ncbi:hypothetical protein [Oleiharenicola lentus]|uniref:hypothetical protein n=1 Tax=Oleiharenicola lentus TaxID=2508720 RepID=UPI003F676798
MRNFFAVLVVLISAHLGHAYTKSIIIDSEIRNPSVGFYGITLKIPANWSIFPAVQDIKLPTSNNAQRAWRMAKSYDGAPGNTTHEIVTLHDGSNGIALAIVTGVGADWPPEKFKKDYSWALAFKAKGFAFPAGEVFVREVSTIGQRSFAKIGRTLPIGGKNHVNFVYLIVLGPSYEISLNGVASEENRAALEAAMDEMMKSLVTRKK